MDRRDFLKKSLVSATVAGAGVAAVSKQEIAVASSQKQVTDHIPPGQLDEYYGIWSGGQSGEIRIIGLPSMRELMRVPVFNHDAATGWGRTDFSKELLGGRITGDTHHVHLSYTDGTYDGRYIYVNDKAQSRLARISIPNMEVDAIVNIPNSQGTHGIFPQRHRTGLVLCNSEFRIPVSDDPADHIDPSTYVTFHTAVDGETMEVVWQVMVDSNLDLCAADYKGLYSFATAYNTEGGVRLEDMISLDRDFLIVFNLERIAQAVKEGRTFTLKDGDGDAPIVDAREEDSPYVLRIPIPKSPHGVNIDPTGRYAVCSGKLSPTVSVVDIEKIADAFAGLIKPRDCVVAEHEVGLGPLHTAFDGRGNGYTSLFIDSNITKWNIEKAIRAYQGEDVNPIVDRLDVYYQVGHTNASMSETKDADGKWLIALCKLSKDRFLNVGPLHPENDQLIDISGEKMKLVHDGPAYAEPHDCILLPKDLIHPLKFNDKKGPRHELYKAWAKEDKVKLTRHGRVFRKGDRSVRVYMPCKAPKFKLREFEVFEGDEVQVIVTNTNNVADLPHGLTISQHDVNMLVNALDTQSITFTAGKPGVYWYYCPYFCHALHLEMRGRMIVKPRPT